MGHKFTAILCLFFTLSYAGCATPHFAAPQPLSRPRFKTPSNPVTAPWVDVVVALAGLGRASGNDLKRDTQALVPGAATGLNLGGRPDSLLGLGLVGRSEVDALFSQVSKQIGQMLTSPAPPGVFRQSAAPASINLATQFQGLLTGLQSTLGGYLEANYGTINSVCNSWGQMRPQFPSLGIYQALVGQDSPAWGGLLDFACNAFSPEYAAAQATAAPSEGLLTPFLVQAQQGASSATNAVGQLWSQATGAAAGLAGQGVGNLGRFITPGGGMASATSSSTKSVPKAEAVALP